MFTVLRSVKKTGQHVYSTQKLVSVILILVVTFTVAIFGQIQCKKMQCLQSSRSVIFFGHLYSVILTSLKVHNK